MRLHELRDTVAERISLPLSHPILLKLNIDPVDWQRLKRLIEDDPSVRIMAYDEPANGLMIVQIACASRAVRNGLSEAW